MNQRSDCIGSQDMSRVGHNMAMPIIDLSNLHRENPRSWIRKCKKFF